MRNIIESDLYFKYIPATKPYITYLSGLSTNANNQTYFNLYPAPKADTTDEFIYEKRSVLNAI